MASNYSVAAIAARHTVDDLARIDHKPYVSIDEAVALTGVSRSTVVRALTAGELPRRKVGARVLIARADLDAWIGGDS